MADFAEMMAALHDGRIDWGTPADAAPIMAAPDDISTAAPANADMKGLSATPPQMGGKLDYKTILSGIAGMGGAMGGGGGDSSDLAPVTFQPTQQFGRLGASGAYPFGR